MYLRFDGFEQENKKLIDAFWDQRCYMITEINKFHENSLQNISNPVPSNAEYSLSNSISEVEFLDEIPNEEKEKVLVIINDRILQWRGHEGFYEIKYPLGDDIDEEAPPIKNIVQT